MPNKKKDEAKCYCNNIMHAPIEDGRYHEEDGIYIRWRKCYLHKKRFKTIEFVVKKGVKY